MNNFRRLATGLDVAPILAELAAHPELWGQHPERIDAPGSPHRESQDIWLRFRDPAELHEPADYSAPHWAVWYPAAALLPSLRPLIFDLMRQIEAVYLGGVMLTRIPAGGRIYPHVDRGWHAETMNRKAYIILAANGACLNTCGDELVVMAPGEAWEFRNDITHSVDNAGTADRIAAIVTCRSEP